MKIVILQFDNRPPEQLGPLTLLVERNRAYAERHGYEHRFITTIDADLPVYWLKPHFCRQALAGGADMVLWLDTDAVIQDVDRRIESLFEGPEIMVAASDNPAWISPFNAGVMALRGAAGVALMDRWLALFPRHMWTRSETAWICNEEWAGPAYEQGTFNARLRESLLASGELRLAEWTLLQSPFPLDGAFTLHFAGVFKANLPAYLHTLGYRRVIPES